MPPIRAMPPIDIDTSELKIYGKTWRNNNGRLKRTPPYSSIELGGFFDSAVATALAEMLGGIEIEEHRSDSLLPPKCNCVELGKVRIIGGVRPQNFDVGYRPDGVRIVFDSKTLNDFKSVRKNWQNMINDLNAQATTVHTRFPYALVTFMVACPEPTVDESRREEIIETLDRLCGRDDVNDPSQMAEAIAFVLWDPDDGTINVDIPLPKSSLRIEHFSKKVEGAYKKRYKGLPPHR